MPMDMSTLIFIKIFHNLILSRGAGALPGPHKIAYETTTNILIPGQLF